MNYKVILGVIVTVVVVLGAGYIVQNSNNDDNTGDTMMKDVTEDTTMMDGSELAPDQALTNDRSDTVMENGSKTEHGSYKDYSSSVVTSEQAAGNKVVLFFHAPWCPFCKAANSEFLKRTNEIPAGVTVLKTDYDSSLELKKKYGVTYQHTFVQIDKDGNLVTKWSGGDIDNLKKYIK